jgi:hypothetical protein
MKPIEKALEETIRDLNQPGSCLLWPVAGRTIIVAGMDPGRGSQSWSSFNRNKFEEK